MAKQRWMSLKRLTPKEQREHVRLLARERYAGSSGERKARKKRDPLLDITPIDLAYIAGLIDGEGTICCLAHKKGKTHYPVVSIVMTDFAVIEWVAEKWNVARSSHRRDEAYLPQAFVRLSGERASLICNLLLPYLKVKRRQAELVQSFPLDGRIGPGKKLNAELNAQRLTLRDEINGLNLKPRNPNYRRGGQ